MSKKSIMLRLNNIMAVKYAACEQFCCSETNMGNCPVGGNLLCCEYNPKGLANIPERCHAGLSNIFLFDIQDVVAFGCTPRTSCPSSILQESERLLESAVPR